MTSWNVRVKALPHASTAEAVANTGVAGQLIVDGAGRLAITGATLSITLIVCALVDALPHPSVAVHVRVTLYDPAQLPGVVTSAKVSVKLLPQPSDAVGVAKDGVAGQKIVEGAGKSVMTGATLSTTLMVCDLVDALPQTSNAVHVRVTLYDPAQLPGVVTSAKVSVNGLLHASVALAVAKTGVAGQLIVDGAGSAAMTGGVLSWTVTVCTADAELPHTSVAVHILLTIYSAGQSPGMKISEDDSIKAYPQASEALTEKDGNPGQLIVVLAGIGVIKGGVTSCTPIVCAAVELLPHASVAVHVLVTL